MSTRPEDMEISELPPFAGPELAGNARRDAPFVLAGRRAVASGLETAGLEELRVHPYGVLRRLRLAEAVPVAVRLTPSGLERRLELDGRELVERIVVPPAAPGAVLEWEVLPARAASAACFEPVELELEWSCELDDGGGAAPGLRGSTTGRRLLVEASDGRVAAFEASRTLSAAVEDPGAGRRAGRGVGCRVGVRLAPGERFRLTVAAAADMAGLERALAELADPAAAVQARAAAAQRRLAAALAVGVPEPVAGLALRWAALRLPSFLAESDGAVSLGVVAGYGGADRIAPSAAAALRVGLAALAAGDAALGLEAACAALARAEAADPDAAHTAILLHAMHFLWTGAAEPVRAAWPRLLALAEALPEPGTDTGPGAADRTARAAAALGRLALAGESLGLGETAAALRARAERLAPAEAAARALALAGGWDAWLEPPGADSAGAWLERAAAGFDGARALWRGPAGASDATATAQVIGGVAYGMLGVEPDAPRARLRLRPRLPVSWDRADFERIRMGDAEIRLGYVRRETVHRFELEQVGGAVPLRVVLEPAVPGTVRAARVDGTAASLDRKRWGDRTLVPVQLVLDERRTLEIEAEPEVRPEAGGAAAQAPGAKKADPLRRGPAGR